MIRVCGASVWNVLGTAKFSQIASLNIICISKRFQTTEILENAKKCTDTELQLLKRERQVEVCPFKS